MTKLLQYSSLTCENEQKKKKKKKKRGSKEKKLTESKNGDFFSVRRSDFSLKIWAIRPSVVFRTRRKAALRGEGFAWISDLRTLDKLLKSDTHAKPSPHRAAFLLVPKTVDGRGFSLLGFYFLFKYFTNV